MDIAFHPTKSSQEKGYLEFPGCLCYRPKTAACEPWETVLSQVSVPRTIVACRKRHWPTLARGINRPLRCLSNDVDAY
jgi:hypothetical protein